MATNKTGAAKVWKGKTCKHNSRIVTNGKLRGAKHSNSKRSNVKMTNTTI